ncbi:ATP-binding cassette domain-containing protein [Roseibium sp.]|uniref:ABC transporter ATP-binding protein n=1 Tax=Roseibium sp. TaxID=1936156 RepID=UPI0032631BDE
MHIETTGPTLKFRNVSLACGTGTIVENLSFRISGAGLTGLFGGSGSGKSSLCRAATGLLDKDVRQRSGEILFNGRPVGDMEETDLRRKVLYLPQKPVAFHGSVLRNLALPQICIQGERRKSRHLDAARAACLQAGLPCDGVFLGRSAETLSVGQLQRLAIARALVLEPQILLFDEPTSALDPLLTAEVGKTLTRIAGSKPVVVVTHDMRIAPSCKSVLFLEKTDAAAPVLHQGTFEEIFGTETSPGYAFAHPDFHAS